MNLRYQLDFSRFYEHLVDVQMCFKTPIAAPSLSMVTWIAGSYLIREFSKNITAVDYQIGKQVYRSEKLNKNTYLLSHAQAGDEICVRYEVYCHDLSIRSAFVDQLRLFGNFSSLLLLPDYDKYTPAAVSLCVPKQFMDLNPNSQLACGLTHSQNQTDEGIIYQLQSLPAFDYLDYPFEISEQSEFAFDVTNPCHVNFDKPATLNIKHRFFISGRHYANLDRLKYDVQKICQAYLNWLGNAPFEHYTFMTTVTDKDYGGLEHINSTALISPRTDLPSYDEKITGSDGYQRFLGLCSHEYFHAWWVKTVRPDVMLDNELTQEAYTPLLWVFEGFTSYIDDLMLLASGVISKPSYLKLVSDQITRYQQTDGRTYQSVAESSFDTWIKLYRPDENTNNQGISYYNKGALVALLLDLMLITHSDGKYRLFDVIKECYEHSNNQPYGLTTEKLGQIISSMMGADNWQAFYQNYVIGTKPLPLEDYLSKFGIDSDHIYRDKIWGMSCQESSEGLKITHLYRQSAASLAGLSVGDTIIAIDGLKASKSLLVQLDALQNNADKSVSVHAFRRDELMQFTVSAIRTRRQKTTLSGDGGSWLQFSRLALNSCPA